jgi:hypothetical protein
VARCPSFGADAEKAVRRLDDICAADARHVLGATKSREIADEMDAQAQARLELSAKLRQHADDCDAEARARAFRQRRSVRGFLPHD